MIALAKQHDLNDANINLFQRRVRGEKRSNAGFCPYLRSLRLCVLCVLCVKGG